MRAPEGDLDGLWLFDGVCNFCSGSVASILRLDRRGAIRFVPLQSAYGRRLCVGAGLDPDDPQSFLFFDRGRPLERSAAILALLDWLPAPWRWARVLAIAPEPWRDRAYDWLARNRYRLFGRKDVCMVPPAAVRARFILDPPA